MNFATAVSPHLKPRASVTRVMASVLLALVPGIAALWYFFGWGVLIHVILALLSAWCAEALMLGLRRRPIRPALGDLSAAVTAVLLAISLPPIAPWWITVSGAMFAIVIAKHLYGGLGYNPFNPAMAGYVLLLISFPKHMTAWSPPEGQGSSLDFIATLRWILLRQLPDGISYDAMTMATPLDAMKTQLGLQKAVAEISQGPIFGLFAGKGSEWVASAFLLGGVWLVWRRYAAWQIPTGILASLAVLSTLFYWYDSAHYTSPLFQLFSGATMLGAFFIATDPVTAATTPRGRLIYGTLIGVLVFVIRVWGGYPDAMAFAVLLMNFAAPTIDYYTRPRVFGHSS